MATKKTQSFTLDYSTVKELKERAKINQKSSSQFLQDLIDKSFFEEKTETKINEIDKKMDVIKQETLDYVKNAANILYHKLHKDYEELNKKIR